MVNMKHHKHGHMSHKEGERTHKHAHGGDSHHDAHLRASDDKKHKTHMHNAALELERHKGGDHPHGTHHHVVEKHHVEGSKHNTGRMRNSSNTTENRKEPGDYENHIMTPPHRADKPGV